MMKRPFQPLSCVFVCLSLACLVDLAWGQKPATRVADLPIITEVEHQPLAAQVSRVAEALDYVGAPLSAADRKALQSAATETDAAKGVREIQRVLDPHVLALVNINPESRVKGVQSLQ